MRPRATAAACLLCAGYALAQEAEPPPEEGEATPEEGVEAVEVIGEPDPVAEPARTSFFDGWAGSVEVGLNGASGNTDRFSFRSSLNARRETDEMVTSTSLLYIYAEEDSDKSESRFSSLLRNDWLLEDSPWRVFLEGTAEWDEFKAWDWRVTGAGGLGYEFIMDERTELIGRVGVGFSREFGGADDDIVPEGLLGLDFSHKLSERQKVSASATYYPDLEDLEEFRLIATANWEVLIDPEANLSLKVGVEDRYDSTPGEGFEHNDLSYFAMLVWAF